MSSFGWMLISTLILWLSVMLVLDSVLQPRWSIVKKTLNTLKKLKFWTSSKELQALQNQVKSLEHEVGHWKVAANTWRELYKDSIKKAAGGKAEAAIPLLSDYKP